MRTFAVLLLLPVVASAAVNPVGNAVPMPRANYAIQPIRIASKPKHPDIIRGEFELKASPQAQPATLTGGACMVRQFEGAIACATDNDCNAAAPPGSGHGYCAPGSGPMGAPQGKTCWYKPLLPDIQICKKSLTPLPKHVPLYTPWISVGSKRPVSWRFVTCQNIVPGGCAKPKAVQGVDMIYDYSQPRYFPAVPAPAAGKPAGSG